MAERGSYRSIPVVLLDGKDFHVLSERARWVFVALKMNLGPSGIEVHYRHALAHQLAEQTGAPANAVLSALDALEEAGWIAHEGNVVWIRDQLRFDPSMKPNDEKHRKSIQRHVMGLPRLSIVAEFVAHYPDWFPADEFSAPEAPARPTEGPRKAVATTEDRRPKTEDPIPKTKPNHSAAGAARTEVDAFEDLWKAYPRRSGSNPKNKALKAWRARTKAGADPAEIMAGLRRYNAFVDATGKIGTEFVMQAATFLGPDERWKESWSLEGAKAPAPPAGSEAAGVRSNGAARETPRSDAPRTGALERVDGYSAEKARQAQDDRELREIDAWCKANQQETERIMQQVGVWIDQHPDWQGEKRRFAESVIRSEFHRRIRERIETEAAA